MRKIPKELRDLPQWCCCKTDNPADPNHKRPINPKTGFWADTTDPKTWGTYDQAIACAHGDQVGFMLSDSDPYTIIDLDNKAEHPVSDQTLEWYRKLVEEADSYAEISVSGRGVHIVVIGAVPTGRRRESVEIYSKDRFMIMTGNVIEPHTVIHPRQELTTWLWEQLEAPELRAPAKEFKRVDQPERLTDDQVMEMAWWAENGKSFKAYGLASGQKWATLVNRRLTLL